MKNNRRYVIENIFSTREDLGWFWKKNVGWIQSIEEATIFSEQERLEFELPSEGGWKHILNPIQFICPDCKGNVLESRMEGFHYWLNQP